MGNRKSTAFTKSAAIIPQSYLVQNNMQAEETIEKKAD